MAIDTINLPNEDRMHVCNCKCKGTKSINSQLLPVSPSNGWLVAQGVKLKAEVFRSQGNQQQAEHPMGIVQIITCATTKGGAKHIPLATSKCNLPTIQPTTIYIVDR